MNRDEQDSLEELFWDVMDSGLPDPELLARYATTPNSLTSEERDQVETAMRRSPVVMDELDTIRGFDFGTLNADRDAAGGRRLTARVISLVTQPTVWAGLMAAAALAFWIAFGGGRPNDSARESPRIAEESDVPRESVLPDSSRPERAFDLLGEGAERLAESGEATDLEPPVDKIERQRERPSSESIARIEPKAVQPTIEGSTREQSESVQAHEGTDLNASETRGDAQPEREILVAMVIPEYDAPFGAAMRDRRPFVIRSSSGSWPDITVLAPAHVARSANALPTLSWHIDRLPTEGAFYLTISGPADEPLIENRPLPMPKRAGIQSTSLASLGVELRPHVEYRWSIAHRLEGEGPPTRYALGWIETVEMSKDALERVDHAESGAVPDTLAREGYWYDALQATLDLTARYPRDERPRAALRSLLEQGGISDLGF
jgi:hypothetical protein